ncbi:MAG: PAS domain S-box protein, partial [Chitinivibrionales bacterium]|nr:PAS domain S-box protein [Chitinivibrionales bacterium]
NDMALRLLGYSREELLAMRYPAVISTDEDIRRAQEALASIARHGYLSAPTEYRLKRKDGTDVWVQVEGSLLNDENDKAYAAIAVALDITENKRAEQQEIRLQRLLAAIRNVNQLIVRERDRYVLIDSVCRIMTDVPEYFSAWIALLGEDHELTAAASAGELDGLTRFVEDLKESKWPWCIKAAMEETGVVMLREPASEARCRGCRSACVAPGAAQMLVRIEIAGIARGILGVTMPAHTVAADEELGLIKEVAGDVGFGLYRIELEEGEIRSRKELAMRNRFIETVLESVPLGIMVVEPHIHVCRYINRSLIALYGWPVHRMRNIEFLYEYAMPDTRHREEMKARVHAALSGGDISRLRWVRVRICPRRGAPRHVNISFIPIPEQETVVVSFYDVTPMVRMEEELVHSAERYATYMRFTSDGVYRAEFTEAIPSELPPAEQIDLIYDREFVAEANDSFARMYGYSRGEDVAGKAVEEFHGGRSNPLNREFFRKFVENGYRIVNFVSREQTHDGNERFFANNAFGLVENGKLVRIWGTQRDVTDLRRAEEALRESEERFRRLAEGIRIIPWEANIDKHEFLYVGPRCEDILGYPPALWYDNWTFWEEHIHSEDRKHVVERCIQRVKDKVQDYTMEYRMIAADGRTVWILDVVNTVCEDGKPTKLRGYFVDISGQKKAEFQLKHYRDELADKNRELQRVNASLEESNRRLVEAGNIKTEFVSVASHELRTPVTTVLAFTQILLDTWETLDANQRYSYLSMIEREARRLGKLAEDLLDISRIESGRSELHFSEVSLRDIAQEVV